MYKDMYKVSVFKTDVEDIPYQFNYLLCTSI